MDICPRRRHPSMYLFQSTALVVFPSPTLTAMDLGVSPPWQRSSATLGKTVTLSGLPFSHLSNKKSHFFLSPSHHFGGDHGRQWVGKGEVNEI